MLRTAIIFTILPARPGPFAYLFYPGTGWPIRAASVPPAVTSSAVPVSTSMILTIFSFFPNDRSYTGRPAVLPGILFADMNRDTLISILFLFELRLCSTAGPFFKTAFFVADQSARSFFGPASHLASAFFRLTDSPAALDLIDGLAFSPGLSGRRFFLIGFTWHCFFLLNYFFLNLIRDKSTFSANFEIGIDFI